MNTSISFYGLQTNVHMSRQLLGPTWWDDAMHLWPQDTEDDAEGLRDDGSSDDSEDDAPRNRRLGEGGPTVIGGGGST